MAPPPACVWPGVLTHAEVAAANASIDGRRGQFATDTPVGTLSRGEPALQVGFGRIVVSELEGGAEYVIAIPV
jgi:hypothetical protein